MTTFRTAALVAATITMGLMAGLFYAFSISVMPGLRRTDDRTMTEAMRRINVAILNGWFAIGFGGALVFTALATVLHLGRPPLPWILAGLVLYLAALAITGVVNVPLNNQLLAATEAGEDPALIRGRFEARWIRWNHLRTLACTAALACLVWAAVLPDRLAD